ncbi:hypothetical protein INR49_012923, partial [Caranx melampygus]
INRYSLAYIHSQHLWLHSLFRVTAGVFPLINKHDRRVAGVKCQSDKAPDRVSAERVGSTSTGSLRLQHVDGCADDRSVLIGRARPPSPPPPPGALGSVLGTSLLHRFTSPRTPLGSARLYCNATTDEIGTCWPRSSTGRIVERPCPEYINGVKYNTTSKILSVQWQKFPKIYIMYGKWMILFKM